MAEKPGRRDRGDGLAGSDSAPAKVAADVSKVLVSQFHAALAMLHDAIERCPEESWTRGDRRNPFWQIAYHTLYFTYLYLHPSFEEFEAWPGHRPNHQHFDDRFGPRDPVEGPWELRPYRKDEILHYVELCDEFVDEAFARFDILSPESGFHWYRVSKLEHQVNNVRHLQHHVGQLIDRLRNEAGLGTSWVKSGSEIIG